MNSPCFRKVGATEDRAEKKGYLFRYERHQHLNNLIKNTVCTRGFILFQIIYSENNFFCFYYEIQCVKNFVTLGLHKWFYLTRKMVVSFAIFV